MAPHAVMEASKKERLEARLTPEQKEHIEHAARIKGTSVSAFVVLSADDAAMRTIREQEAAVSVTAVALRSSGFSWSNCDGARFGRCPPHF